ncbi:hypothetical protein BK133_02150 [Paenibacillus sp. FSL H8-0548]|uniref:extracellular solute-binding protein n=1 Tax=Paenibacillus sp. FSL H8-0548 TaxID=1920422 RepID=UPI00096FCFB8|nr:extracellular solute-binding protein [Paenibacillus sp. FSL H8-0548]OMF38345.1 hypothetical protein BK133_02150 [Paenibacillus sp. FSL H8-0548]
MKRNNKKVKKLASLVLIGTITATTLIGCSQTNNGNNTPKNVVANGAETNGTKVQDPLKINIMLPIFKTNYPKDNSPVAAEIEKITNTDIHFEWVPNASYADKFNITLASTKLPTIMYIGDVKSPSFVNAVKSGAFWEVGPYLKDYKNLSEANPVTLNNSSIDGKNYGLYRARALGRNGVQLRKDWLEQLNLELPQTVDEFYEMLKAFKEQDPDNNGKADTYGMVLVKWTGQWASGFDTIKLWFGSPNKWGDVDGQLVPEHQTAEYFEALTFMKKLYDEKLINQDFAIYDSAKWVDPIVNNQAGVIVDVIDGAARVDDKIHAALAAAGTDQPDVHFMDVIGGVKGADGKLHTLPTSGFAGILAIPKSAVKTEDELKRVLAFLDQLSEPEMQTMLNYGLEGVHYTLDENDAVVISKDTVLMESEVEGINQMGTYSPVPFSHLVQQTPLRLKQTELQIENEAFIVANPAEPFISKVYTEKGAQLDNIINDARIKYIVGQIDEAAFKDALALWRKSGGDDLIKEMNELYAASKK